MQRRPRSLFALNITIRLNSRFQSTHIKFIIIWHDSKNSQVGHTCKQKIWQSKDLRERRLPFPSENGICCEVHRRVSFRWSYRYSAVSEESFLNREEIKGEKSGWKIIILALGSHSFKKKKVIFHFIVSSHWLRKKNPCMTFLYWKVSSWISLFFEPSAR